MTDDVADARAADPQVIPYLLYADAGAAMDWLVRPPGWRSYSVHDPDGRQWYFTQFTGENG